MYLISTCKCLPEFITHITQILVHAQMMLCCADLCIYMNLCYNVILECSDICC